LFVIPECPLAEWFAKLVDGLVDVVMQHGGWIGPASEHGGAANISAIIHST
jgi:hypothetical protein